MKKRGFWDTFLVFAPLTAIAFALIWSLVYSLLMGYNFFEVLKVGIWAGLAFGVLFGLFVAYTLKTEVATFPFDDQSAFKARLQGAIGQIGFTPVSQTDTTMTFKPAIKAGLLSGNLIVQFEQNKAIVTGGSANVKKLQKILNV